MLSSIVMRIPIVGMVLYRYCVGDLAVTGGMIRRVYSVHVWMAFILVFLVLVHLFYLHKKGSNKVLSVLEGYRDIVRFHSFFRWKDGLMCFVVMFKILLFVWLRPKLFLDRERFIPAKSLVTPGNIKPEWYFLPFYAMLRSVYSKIGGMFVVIFFLFILWVPRNNLSCAYDEVRQYIYWVICSVFVFLGYVGGCHLAKPFIVLGKIGIMVLIISLIFFKMFWTNYMLLLVRVVCELALDQNFWCGMLAWRL